jgi:hypothetical protein
MFEVKIKNLNNEKTHGAEFETELEAQSWVSSIVSMDPCPWGKVAGAYLESELSSQEMATTTEAVEIDGLIKHVIPDQFTVEIAEKQTTQEEININAKKYLSDTDWHIVKHIEVGYQVPQSILDARALARQSIVE